MKFIYFNPETRMGYITDPLTPEEGAAIATGIGFFMAMYITAALLTAIIVLPFVIVSGLDKFLISFFTVNKNFIIGTAIVLILIKLLTVRLSTALIVQFLFSLMILIPILYILLYKFHMADITIIVGKRFEVSRHFLKDKTVQALWIESLLRNVLDALSKIFFYLTKAAQSIDYSAFASSLRTINIVSILLCIGKSILWWGLITVFSLLIFVIGVGVSVIIVALPYCIAFGVLMLANNLIYKTKLNYIRYLKF